MIEARDLAKNYGSVRALRGVSFSIQPGQVVGLLGPNGAGKSTAMRIATGYLAPTGGQVTVDGIDVMDDPRACQARIGYLPEGNPLYLDMRLREILCFTASMRGLRGLERKKAIGEAVQDAGLQGKEHVLIGQLSRGYRQRVGLAMALLHRPPILILDEPSSGLDPNQQREMRRFIRHLGESRTIVFSTHILAEVEAVCDRVLVISSGRLVADGSVEAFRSQADRGFGVALRVRGVLEDLRAALGGLPFTSQVDLEDLGQGLVAARLFSEGALDAAASEAVVAAVQAAGLGLIELQRLTPSLDEAFAHVTARPPPEEDAAPPAETSEEPAPAAAGGVDDVA